MVAALRLDPELRGLVREASRVTYVNEIVDRHVDKRVVIREQAEDALLLGIVEEALQVLRELAGDERDRLVAAARVSDRLRVSLCCAGERT